MALSVQLAESTSKRWEFEVFLSFTGELDCVNNFASSLYAALWSKGITSMYDEKIKGESQRLKAIEDSRFAIVLLSQDFASSTRCLNELLKIVESRKEFGQEVFPIFYDVDPSDVINQRGSFAVHEKGFVEKEKVQRWRCALTQVGNLTGWNSKYWHETNLIENIASETLTNICSKLPSYHNNLVGIPSRMDELNSYLRIGLDDVRFVGIYGVGGIGKTTLARHIYERISSQFEICYFLGNVSKKASKNGLVHLQRKLLSHINISSMETFDTNEGKVLLKSCFYNKKVLLVLDNVNDISQLESLVESPEWFGAGSRVIITTRDMQLLKSHGVHGMYEMKTMNKDESLQLLSKKAFRKDHPEEGYLKLSKSMIQYARGLPLVLNVLGCFLCGRSIPEWENILDKLEQIANNSIHQTLKICYDGLDREEQTMFLDIASFFKGWEKNKVVQVLKDSGLYSKIEIGLRLLIEKSLLIEKDNCLEIHDLLDELAMSIISQESSDNVEQRNRLWDLRDINQIFESHKGDSQSQTNNALNLPRDLQSLYRSLKVFLWKDIPSKDIQLETPLNEFVRVSMQYSNLKKLWNGIQWLEKLEFMDLSHSKKLIETPNFLGVPNLESLIFQGCTSLVKVHPSLGELKKLVLLNLRDCKSLKILPRKLEMDSLVVLLLCGCSKVTKLPEFGECMENLAFLDLQDTAITELPKSLGFLTGLRDLNLRGCKDLVCLPFRTFHNLKHLRSVQIFGGLNLILEENLLHNVALAPASENRDAGETSIVPQSRNLNTISIYGCEGPPSNSGPMWLWRIVGVVSSICGVVSYGLSSSFELIFGEWNLLKIFLYCTASLIVCGMMLFPSACQVAKNLLERKHVVFVMLVLTTIYTFFYDQFVTGKPDALSLISTVAFALTSLSLSRQTSLGFDVGMSYFFIGFLMLQLMKINLILVIFAVVVCYFFIHVHSYSDPHLLPVIGTARVPEWAINVVHTANEAEIRALADNENTQEIV